jgi:signal transduction histidine kinase
MKALVGKFRFSLRCRLLVLVAIVSIPLVWLMLHTATQEQRDVEVWQQERHRQLTGWQRLAEEKASLDGRIEEQLVREVQNRVGEPRELLQGLANYCSNHLADPVGCQRCLSKELTFHTNYANFGLLTANGDVRVSALPSVEGENMAERTFFRLALQTRAFAISRCASDPDGKPQLCFGQPVFNWSNKVEAVLFATVDLDSATSSEAAPEKELPPGASWTKVDRNGTILFHEPMAKAWIGRSWSDPELLRTVFRLRKGVWEAPDSAGQPALHAYVVAESPLAGQEVASILSVSKGMLFSVVDRRLLDQRLGRYWKLARYLMWLGLAGGGVVLGLGWLGSHWLVVRPVRTLVESAARLGAGELGARTGLRHGRDELGQLAGAFDQMARTLEEREQDRARAVEGLQEHSLKLDALSRRLVAAQETERRHIARELHDEIGQALTVAELNLQALVASPEGRPLAPRLEQSLQEVEHVLEQVHDLSLDLRPSMLDDLGLAPALQWYLMRQANLVGLRAEFQAERLEPRLDPLIETTCFRVAQEALTNVVRHAQARAVAVQVQARQGLLELVIRDDGVGFDVPATRAQAVRGASLGLLSMEERALLVGGGLECKSTPGHGTEIHAWFPLTPAAVRP